MCCLNPWREAWQSSPPQEEAYLAWIKHPCLLVPMQTVFACSVCLFVCLCVFAWAVAFLTSPPLLCILFWRLSHCLLQEAFFDSSPTPNTSPPTHTHPNPSFPAAPLLPSAHNSKMISLWVCSHLQTLSSCRVWTVSGCERVYPQQLLCPCSLNTAEGSWPEQLIIFEVEIMPPAKLQKAAAPPAHAPWPFQDTEEHSSLSCKTACVPTPLACILPFRFGFLPERITQPPVLLPMLHLQLWSPWIKKDSQDSRILLQIQYVHTFPGSPADLHFL